MSILRRPEHRAPYAGDVVGSGRSRRRSRGAAYGSSGDGDYVFRRRERREKYTAAMRIATAAPASSIRRPLKVL